VPFEIISFAGVTGVDMISDLMGLILRRAR
jgi:hypothetical protein